MKKNIKVAIIATMVMYIAIGIEAYLAYMMSDVWNLSWYIRLCNGMTFTQLISKALANPWLATLWIAQYAILVPIAGIVISKVWEMEQSKKEAVMN